MSLKKPNLEDLYKDKDEQQYSRWEQYLLRQTENMKQIKKYEKKKRDDVMQKQAKEKEHFELVQGNIQDLKEQFKEKTANLNQKAK